MKALSITEPYATLIREKMKTIETRSWKTNYRGDILIHASATRIPKEYRRLYRGKTHQGYIIAKARLVDCIFMTKEFLDTVTWDERLYGFYSEGRYAWILEHIEPIEPIPAKGRLGLWDYKEVEA